MSYKKSRRLSQEEMFEEMTSQLNRIDDEEDLNRNLAASVKLLSRRWLQEAYLDGMMFADKLHKLLADKETQTPRLTQASAMAPAQNDLALAVRKELENLGFVAKAQVSSHTNQFVNVMAGLVLILVGSVAIGGAISYYNVPDLLSRPTVANVQTPTLSETESSSSSESSSTASLADIAIPEPSQPLAGEPFQDSEPKMLDQQAAANNQALQSPEAPTAPNAEPKVDSSNSNSSASSSSSSSSSCSTSSPTGNQNFNINDPADRASLRCVLDQYDLQQR